MKIKIELEGNMISLREYAVRNITEKITKRGREEKGIWYNAAAVRQELVGAGAGKLVKCWLKNAWPLPQLHSLRSRLSHLR